MDLRHTAASTAGYPRILFIGQGSIEETQDFFSDLWPEARVIANSSRDLYKAFGLRRGGVMQLVGPSVWACGIRAASKGNFVSKPMGDPQLLPGAFLVHHNTIVWEHRARHAGDYPKWAEVPRVELSV
ncbi:MAG: peroxiredoxin-like family protein [Anaerolineae bacterium]